MCAHCGISHSNTDSLLWYVTFTCEEGNKCKSLRSFRTVTQLRLAASLNSEPSCIFHTLRAQLLITLWHFSHWEANRSVSPPKKALRSELSEVFIFLATVVLAWWHWGWLSSTARPAHVWLVPEAPEEWDNQLLPVTALQRPSAPAPGRFFVGFYQGSQKWLWPHRRVCFSAERKRCVTMRILK